MAVAALMLTACVKDNDSNPVLNLPETFVLNSPNLSQTGTYDLYTGTTESITFTCEQPAYGFPAYTTYYLYVSLHSDMSSATNLTYFTGATTDVDAQTLAAALTQLLMNEGKTEEDFPLYTKAYFQARADLTSAATGELGITEIQSNIICLDNIYLAFSLAPVVAPSELYIVGNFCGWDWTKCVTTQRIYGTYTDTHSENWHIVYIDESGFKFNTTAEWDGGEVGYSTSSVKSIGGDLADKIKDSGDGNFATSEPGWYIVNIKADVNGRDIEYNVDFYEAEVHFIGWVLPSGDWSWTPSDDESQYKFTIEGEGANAYFVSPEITKTLVGTEENGCLRMCVCFGGYEWWNTEFILFVGDDPSKDVAISYRGDGGDQTRVPCTAGTKVYLNFTADTGYIL